MTTQFDSVLKGIYTFEGDALNVCVAKHEDGARPTAFEAPRGSDRMLIRLKLAASDRKPAPSASPPPSSAEDDEAREANIRRLIVGSWAMTDSRGTLTIIFFKEGTFRGSRVYSQSAKTIFGAAADSASGTWSFGNSTLEAYVQATTARDLAGHRMSGHVDSIGHDTMVLSTPSVPSRPTTARSERAGRPIAPVPRRPQNLVSARPWPSAVSPQASSALPKP